LAVTPQEFATGQANWLELKHLDHGLQPIAGAAYTVTFADGSVRQGVLDAQGFARLEDVPSGQAKVEYHYDPSAQAARTGVSALASAVGALVGGR
jgi:hypothetical protein